MVTINVLGTSLSGGDGSANRTFTILDINIDISTLQIYVNGLFMHVNVDYTVTGYLVTFLNSIWNTQAIEFNYFYTASPPSASSYYNAGTTDVYNFLGFNAADATEINLTDTMIIASLQRAEAEIDVKTKTHFSDGTQSTPDYVIVADEKLTGQGVSNRAYFTKFYPLADLSAASAGGAAIGDSTINVDSTTGFPAAGTIFSGTNKIAYTGKSSTSFTGVTGITTAIATGDTILPYGIEISIDDEGTTPSWTVATPDDQYDADLTTGRFYLYMNKIIPTIYTITQPPQYVPNRARISYIYGWNTIPPDITRAELMIACRDLLHTIVRRAYMRGLDQFQPNMIEIDSKLIDETIARYQNVMFDQTTN